MTGEPDLTGCEVLVVEDDYFLATDAARALDGAGAKVLGPCSTESDARNEIAERRPDAVLLDINLGTGSSFKLAEALKDQGIPFVFVTGYDQDVIPTEFDGVPRLEKPVPLVSSPNLLLPDRAGMAALEQANRRYEIVFTAFDTLARRAAPSAVPPCHPGAMALTRIFSLAYSAATWRVKPITPALDVE